eukprot:c26197_g1_i1.p1 GENE.c26197_g1_i1~~c26197_g1_i1.p1  ORF type:complete len:513 (-),score=104.43 c26197_g1_i1:676-2214(-)
MENYDRLPGKDPYECPPLIDPHDDHNNNTAQDDLPFVMPLPPSGPHDYAPLCTHDPDEILGDNPHNNSEPILNINERFQPAKKLRDRAFLIAFLVHLLVVFLIGVKEGFQVYFHHCFSRRALGWTLLMTSLCVVGLASAALVLALLQHFMHSFVTTVMIVSCAAPLVLAAEYVAAGHWGAMVIAFMCSAFAALFLTAIKARINFATSILVVVVSCVRQNYSLIGLAFAAIIPQALWSLFILGAIYGTVLTSRFEASIINWLQILICTFSAFWTFQVIKNVVHATTAGCVASWYFIPDASRPDKPVTRALQRACTISLGSICFGSLLIAIVQTLRTLATYSRKQRRFPEIARIGAIVTAALEGILSYFNKYTLVYVAVYGTNFFASAKNMGSMIRTRGFSAVLNDDITAVVLTFVCAVNALLTTGIAILFASLFRSSLKPSTLTACLWVGYGIMGVVTSVIESAVSTVYVCFMEDSSALRSSHIDAYNSIASAWMIMYGGNFKLSESASASMA